MVLWDLIEKFDHFCECNSMAEYDLPKVDTGVRFPSLAHQIYNTMSDTVAYVKAIERRYSSAGRATHS